MNAHARRSYAASFRVAAGPAPTLAQVLAHAEEELGLLKNVIAPRQIERDKWSPQHAAHKIACQQAIVGWLGRSLRK